MHLQDGLAECVEIHLRELHCGGDDWDFAMGAWFCEMHYHMTCALI